MEVSITAGVIGIISSLTTLSMKINDFRRDFQGATLEIQQLTHEVDDLTLVLKHLEDAQARGMLAQNLKKDLGTVLQRLNETVVEASLFLMKAKSKVPRGMYWAFTGKNQCGQLCRRLESYKSTVNVTLTLSSIISGHENRANDDQLLQGINRIRQQLSGTEDSYVLQRYLMELETSYEGSTVADPAENAASLIPVGEDDTTLRHSTDSDTVTVSTPYTPTAEDPKPETNVKASFERPFQTPDPKPGPRTIQKDIEYSQGSKTSNTRPLADMWSQKNEDPKYTHIIQHGTDSRASTLMITARENKLAGCMDTDKEYGLLFRGFIDQPTSHTFTPLTKQNYDPPDGAFQSRDVVAMEFHDDGWLIAALKCWSPTKIRFHIFLVIWRSHFEDDFERLSPSFDPDNSWTNSLSKNGRRFAYSQKYREVVVYDVDKASNLRTISLPPQSHCGGVVWSDNAETLLICYKDSFGSDTGTMRRTLEFYEVLSGSLIAQVNLEDFSFPPHLDFLTLEFFLAASREELIIVRGGVLPKHKNELGKDSEQSLNDSKSTVDDPVRPSRPEVQSSMSLWERARKSGRRRNHPTNPSASSEPNVNLSKSTEWARTPFSIPAAPAWQIPNHAHFIVRIDLKTKIMTNIHEGKADEDTYLWPKFSPDGSCLLGITKSPLALRLVDTRSGEVISHLPCGNMGSGNVWTFDHDGRMIIVRDDWIEGSIKLRIWELPSAAPKLLSLSTSGS